ncbi:MAG: carbohydrate ABC transporter permease [Bradymonadia bacterium]
MKPRDRAAMRRALLYLSPNLVGFLGFTLVPLVISLVMAFTNWDLKQHNMFHPEASPRFVGLDNFILLLREDEFLRYLGNTLVMMVGIPFGMAGSLGAALLLNTPLNGTTRGDHRSVLLACIGISVVSVLSSALLVTLGLGGSALTIVVCSFGALLLVGGAAGGSTVHRTIFYLPSFTSGVAIFLLWKKIYNPTTGPLNTALEGPLSLFGDAVAALPADLVRSGLFLGFGLTGALSIVVARKLLRGWQDGDVGLQGLVGGAFFSTGAAGLAWLWRPSDGWGLAAAALALVGAAAAIILLVRGAARPRTFTCAADVGVGSGLILGAGALVLQVAFLGLGVWARTLPEQATSGIAPPYWLANYNWAKPALILMGLWAAIGSNNMLLYLAGLSGIPKSLYEAAEIDGARGFTRFWHVTWPQLAPVTFFIFVMSMIGGLQGGFEMARTMTQGGPAGATTTLSYFIFSEGFETGRLGFASAVAWAMFVLVFAITLFNWKFGGRYNED